MKKTILSLTAVLAMFASVPAIYASPVVDSASDVSVNKFVSTEPTVNIIYQSEVPSNEICNYGDSYKGPEIISFKLKPGEHKVVEYAKVRQGEKLEVSIYSYYMILADGSIIYKYVPKGKEIIAEKDGYYSVEFCVPNSDVKGYNIGALLDVDY